MTWGTLESFLTQKISQKLSGFLTFTGHPRNVSSPQCLRSCLTCFSCTGHTACDRILFQIMASDKHDLSHFTDHHWSLLRFVGFSLPFWVCGHPTMWWGLLILVMIASCSWSQYRLGSEVTTFHPSSDHTRQVLDWHHFSGARNNRKQPPSEMHIKKPPKCDGKSTLFIVQLGRGWSKKIILMIRTYHESSSYS